jgi:triphosphoribosyl-dephospho-CoA synthase
MDTREIAICAQLACALEAACPKPGNVNRFHDFNDTKLEHFLASAVAIGDAAKEAAERGRRIRKMGLDYATLGLGELIMRAVEDSQRWHKGGNTNLGIAMLLIPLSAGYGLALGAKGLSDAIVRRELDRAIKCTTTRDALNFYRAIKIAKPGGLGKVNTLDVMDEGSMDKIIRDELNLHHILKLSAEDSIPLELTGKMPITFEVGYPGIMDVYEKTGDLTLATLHGYMRILAEMPDSLIARKKGAEAAKDISSMAREILNTGMSMKDIEEFDRKIRRGDNSLNPGTTADLTASSLMVCLLKGARP